VASPLKSSHVFVNCPFDLGYKPIFDAIVFAIYDLGFVARCALEADDAGEVRLAKIERILEECKYGVHDISCVELDQDSNLPRFNMPLELGLFLGCKRFGGERQKSKVTLILDSERYRYQRFISDIAGQDIHAHRGEVGRAISEVRTWLAAASRRKLLPGGAEIAARYVRFRAQLPQLCEDSRLREEELTFNDLSELIASWLKTNR
jgi:hypothetical protein